MATAGAFPSMTMFPELSVEKGKKMKFILMLPFKILWFLVKLPFKILGGITVKTMAFSPSGKFLAHDRRAF